MLRPQHTHGSALYARRTAIVAAAVLGLIGVSLAATEPLWELSLGVPWRSFGSVKLRPEAQGVERNGTTRFLDGSIREVGAGLYEYRVQDPLRQVDGARLDHIEYSAADLAGGSESLGQVPGLQIDLRRALWTDTAWRGGVTLSLRAFSLDQDLVRGGTVGTATYGVYPNGWPSPNPPGGGPDPAVTRALFPNRDLLERGSAGAVAVRYDLGLRLGELAAGGYVSWRHGPLAATVELAPVLALVDLDMTRTIPADPGGTRPTFREDDGVTTAIPGLRLGAALRWQLVTPFFLEAGADYEWFTEPIEGDFTKIGLDGFSLRAALGCSF